MHQALRPAALVPHGFEVVSAVCDGATAVKAQRPKRLNSPRFSITDEWYGLKNLAKNMHVIFVQNTKGMQGKDYARPNYPETWARLHDKGRVFYTSMGHREDVWENEKYQKLLVGALLWITGQIQTDASPNVETVTPEYQKL